MQYGGFVFRHNPETISVSDKNRVVTHLCPGLGDRSQNLGTLAREVVCSGCFWGDSIIDAMSQLISFRKAAADSKAAILFLPGLAPMRASLKELAFDCRGDGRLIAYTMRFVEDVSP